MSNCAIGTADETMLPDIWFDEDDAVLYSHSSPTVFSDNNPNALERTIAALANLNYESSNQDFLNTRNLCDILVQIADEQMDHWKSVAMERCMDRGEMILGHRKFYAGYRNETKCTNVPMAVEMILEAGQGDVGVLSNCLSANAIKYGEAKNVLGERFGEVFKTTRKDVLKEGERSKKDLIEINLDFVRPKALTSGTESDKI